MKKLSLVLLVMALLPLAMNAETKCNAGVNPANLDTSVAPGEDFYDYACGGWMKANPLGDEYARYGVFDALRENNNLQLKELFASLVAQTHEYGSVGQKVSDLYRLGMDSVRLNNEGAAPVLEALAKINSMKRADLTKMVADAHVSEGHLFFDCAVMGDLMDSNVNTFYLAQASLGMGDRDYYLLNGDNDKKLREKYVAYIEKIFTLAGYKAKDAKRVAKTVLKIETELAQVAMSNVELRDYSAQYNVRSLDQLKTDYPNINWDEYFSGLGLKDVKNVVVMQLASIAKVNEMFTTLKDQEIKDYLAYTYLGKAAGYLSDDFRIASFDFFGKELSGKKEEQPRWKRALGVPNALLGEAVGELYVAKYFAKGSKERMMKLVNNLKISLGEHIAALPWMSESTKINALVKLNAFTVKIGYPDKWRDYSGIEIDPKLSYWANIERAYRFEAAYRLSKYGERVDKDQWWMTPQTVNAYYDPSTNEICFPAGILQAPFFDVDADDASNYGAIGVVIGHEMTHGFDDQGRNFDQNGNMKDWWSETDAENFKKLTSVLSAQYSNIVVIDDLHANGDFTLGENIADQGGLRVSYSAFMKTPQGQSNEKIDGFTPAQRFYLAYANVWAGNIRDAEIVRRTKTDPHSLGRWRVNAALRNIAPFYEAFSIHEGDKMWLAPENRVVIW